MWHDYDLGEPIAERRLTIQAAAPGADSIVVRIGKPQRFPEDEDWFCPFEIVGQSERISHYAAGVDAVQALQLAMRMIEIDLATLNQRFSGRLRWLDETDFGFHQP